MGTIITLRPVDETNARSIVALRVAPVQRDYVASNADSIADAYVDRSMVPMAIYANQELVGFAMYGRDPADGRWWIIRMMIDERFQGRGYGRDAMMALIDLMALTHDCTSIHLGVDPGNAGAIQLYRRLGFLPTGEIEDDEAIMRLDMQAISNGDRSRSGDENVK